MSKTMRFKAHVAVCLRKYCDMSGRADRSEYWDFFLFYYLVVLAAALTRAFMVRNICPLLPDGGSQLLKVLMSVVDWASVLALIAPCYAVTVRRLRDLNYETWLAELICALLMLLYLLAKFRYYRISEESLAAYHEAPWENILILKAITKPYKILLLSMIIQFSILGKSDAK